MPSNTTQRRLRILRGGKGVRGLVLGAKMGGGGRKKKNQPTPHNKAFQLQKKWEGVHLTKTLTFLTTLQEGLDIKKKAKHSA